MIGDGSWAVTTGKVDNNLIVADPLTGQVGYFGTMEMNGLPTWFAARLKVADGKVDGAGNRLAAAARGGERRRSGRRGPQGSEARSRRCTRRLRPSERVPRRKMIDLAERLLRHAAAQQRNSLHRIRPHLFADRQRHKDRQQSGFSSGQFPLELRRPVQDRHVRRQRRRARTGFFSDRRRERHRHGQSFSRPQRRRADNHLTDGTQIHAGFRTPNSFVMLEMFKFRNGKLYRAEVVHADTNYHASSPWTAPPRRE